MAVAALSTEWGYVSSFQSAKNAPISHPEDDVLALPFVRDTSRSERLVSKKVPHRIFWGVSPSHDPIEDYKTGVDYARQAMTYMVQTKTEFILQWAVRDMMRLDRPFSAIEIAFLGEITRCANIAHKVTLWSRERRAVTQ